MKREDAEQLRDRVNAAQMRMAALDPEDDRNITALLADVAAALGAEVRAEVTPLADLQWLRALLRRAAESSESSSSLLEIGREYRQVLRQIHAMQKDTGSSGGSGQAGAKTAAMQSNNPDDWD